MSLFGNGGGGGGGIIGQTLGLTRSTTIAPSNNTQAPATDFSTFTAPPATQVPTTVGVPFNLVLPLNPTVSQKVISKGQEISSYMCCIAGQAQYQHYSLFEIALQDRRQLRGGNARPPQGNLATLNLGGVANPASATTAGGVQPFTLNAGTTPSIGTTGGGLFGGVGTPAPAGGLLGTAGSTPAATGGGLFGGGQANQGGLFGSTLTQPATVGGGGGLFGGATTAPAATGGLFGNAPAPTIATATTGGLFGNHPTPAAGAATGGLFGQPAPLGQVGGGGLFGKPATTTATTGLFGQPQMTGLPGQQQQYQQAQSTTRMDEMIQVMMRLEQAKTISLNQKKKEEEEGRSNKKITHVHHSVNHINYLKSQQQQRDVYDLYTHKTSQPFIEAPYNVKLKLSTDNVKRNEWILLQRTQEMRNNSISGGAGSGVVGIPGNDQRNININATAATRASASNSLLSSSQSMYNQLRQIERASSYAQQTKSVREMDEVYKKEHLDTFSETSYFKRLQKTLDTSSGRGGYEDGMGDRFAESSGSLKNNSIAYLFEQSLKNQVKTFNTTLSMRIHSNRDYVSIPLEVKSTYTIAYLLTMAFDYIEDKLHIQPENLPIYQSNYVLYQPINIDHLLQVQKDTLISELEPNLQGQIGHFELVHLDENDASEIQGEEEMENEQYDIDYEDASFNNDSQKLPIIGEGYEIYPSYDELRLKSPDQLRRFRNFRIKNQFAEICFEDEIDLYGRDFTKDLLITQNEILIHPNEQDNIPVGPGYGLNVRSTIKRFNAHSLLMPNMKFDAQKIERCIRKIASDYKMEIVEPYNPTTDSFTVRVQSF